MRRLWRYAGACLVVGALLWQSLALSAAPAAEGPAGKQEQEVPFQPADGEAFEDVLDNAGFTLRFKPVTGEVAVLDKRTGKIWYSNPPGREEDPLAGEQEHRNMASQFIVYFQSADGLTSMDSYGSSVSLAQHSWYADGDSLRVRYVLGEATFSNDQIPPVISQERLDGFLAKLDPEEAETVRSRFELYKLDELDAATRDVVLNSFPSLKKHSIYVRLSFPSYVGEDIYALLVKAGYSNQELQYDCDDNEVENTYQEPVIYELQLLYQLSDDGLLVTLDPETIKDSETYPLLRVDLLPYFGCGGDQQQGYMLVPDGSGALIRYNNGKQKAEKYWAKLFGDDRALTKWETGTVAEPNVLPVFAASQEDGAFLATIDEGYECAGIYADVAGRSGSYNYVGSFYDIRPFDQISMSGKNTADDQVTMIAPAIVSGPIRLQYHLLPQAAAYDELAAVYQKLLVDQGILKQRELDDAPLNIAFTGALEVKKSFLGFYYEALAAATTFDQAADILAQLDLPGVQVSFSSAVNGGKQQSRLDGIRWIGALGGRRAYEALAKETDVALAAYCRRAVSAGKSITARTLGKDTAKLYAYDFIGRSLIDKSNPSLLLAPAVLREQGERLRDALGKQGVTRLHLLDGVYELDSDFNLSQYYDRRKTREQIEAFLQTVGEQAALSGEKGSYFSLPYLSKVWNIPAASNGYALADESVPFYPLVVRGYLTYCTAPINESPDARTAFLQAVEIGAQLQYTWVHDYVDNPVAFEDNYYNRLYSNSIDQAKAYAQEMAQLHKAIGNTAITGHRRVREGLTCTRYASGHAVYVNYTDTVQPIDGGRVPAQGFLCVEE